ncbi:Ribosome biogenesis protein 1, partial [Physocladia obscura]
MKVKRKSVDKTRNDAETEQHIVLDIERGKYDDVSDHNSDSDEENGNESSFSDSENGADEDEDNEELPEIIPDYASDDSDEETINTIGNVPLEWYEDLDHIGYDIHGKKIPKPAAMTKDALDEFLSTMDDPDSWRSVFNKLEGENKVLTNGDLEIIQRITKKMLPEKDYDPYEPSVDFFSSQTMVHPLSGAPTPKSRFIPSKHEGARIMKIVRAIQKGWKKTTEQIKLEKANAKPKYYDIWGQADPDAKDHPQHIPAPRMSLPDHKESYNPPIEYIPTAEEIDEWKSLDAELRPQNFIPKKHENMRSIGAYERFINERFERCLDLYLCPRVVKNRINIDPESLIPQLPSRKELEPYPTQLTIVYEGHKKRIKCLSVDPTGKWVVSGSDDFYVRCFEILTGRLAKSWKFTAEIQDVKWNPNS